MTYLPAPRPQPGYTEQTPPTQAAQPYWLNDPQQYALEQERYRHQGALDAFGEYSIFALMWSIEDLKAGRVGRCPRCYLSRDMIADAYGQGGDAKCPDCFGSTFEGGYKAIIVRRALWNVQEEDERQQRRGVTFTKASSVQSSADFRMRTGDYAYRSDGSRWQIKAMSSDDLRTGLQHNQIDAATSLGFNYGQVNKEDTSSVAYLLPPEPAFVQARLQSLSHPHYPQDFSDIEVVRGPLLS